jgi:hypothetical protein
MENKVLSDVSGVKLTVNPYFTFKDGGLNAECNLCNFVN